MPRYLISFDDGAMDHAPDEEGPAVGDAAHHPAIRTASLFARDLFVLNR